MNPEAAGVDIIRQLEIAAKVYEHAPRLQAVLLEAAATIKELRK